MPALKKLNTPEFINYVDTVIIAAKNAGVTILVDEFNDILQYFYLTDVDPLQAVKRYVDCRIRLNAIREAGTNV